MLKLYIYTGTLRGGRITKWFDLLSFEGLFIRNQLDLFMLILTFKTT